MGLASLALLALLGGFADELYVQGDYEMAALEYSRILYEEGDTLTRPDEALRLARCWHLLGDFERSLSMYTFLADRLPEGDSRAMAALGAGTVYADLGFYSLSRNSYREVAETALDADLAFRGELLDALTPLHRYEWTTGSAELSSVALRWQGERRLLAEELSSIAAEGEHLSRRSPFWCGFASAILPGSGQMMCGHTSDGLIALGMNAATGLLFYLSLEEDNLSTSILLGWLSLSFYGANVYGGSRAAEYYNATRHRDHFQDIYGRLDRWAGE